MIDPVALAQSLIRCPSVTPADAGALDVVEAALKSLGFATWRQTFEEAGTAPVDNLYARFGSERPNFAFAGHSDVVPVGDAAAWRFDPFGAEIKDGLLYGRGAADMKSAIAAFIAACARVLQAGAPDGSISLLITGDEEGPSVNGTRKLLEWLAAKGEHLDHCLVGEPTATASSGDTIKIGRRGSMHVHFTAQGVQGHTAYPARAGNPIPALATLVSEIAADPLDEGNAHFEPSCLVFTTFDVANPAGNVSPAKAYARCNIRFNDQHTEESLRARMQAYADEVGQRYGIRIAMRTECSGEAFLTVPGQFTDLISQAVTEVAHHAPQLSTTGGTSDARFIKNYCAVAELGLPGTTMHKADECVPVAEIEALTDIYAAILGAYFASTRR